MMARYYIMFDTMKAMAALPADASLEAQLEMICHAREFSDMRLRVNEKRMLNQVNASLRFPLKGKIKTTGMKVNVLIQVHYSFGRTCTYHAVCDWRYQAG